MIKLIHWLFHHKKIEKVAADTCKYCVLLGLKDFRKTRNKNGLS